MYFLLFLCQAIVASYIRVCAISESEQISVIQLDWTELESIFFSSFRFRANGLHILFVCQV